MNIPKEITTPPEGYEWTGVTDYAGPNVPYASYRPYEPYWEACCNVQGTTPEKVHILRKIKPPTVMVEMRRDLVEAYANSESKLDLISIACRIALEREENQ